MGEAVAVVAIKAGMTGAIKAQTVATKVRAAAMGNQLSMWQQRTAIRRPTATCLQLGVAHREGVEDISLQAMGTLRPTRDRPTRLKARGGGVAGRRSQSK